MSSQRYFTQIFLKFIIPIASRLIWDFLQFLTKILDNFIEVKKDSHFQHFVNYQFVFEFIQIVY